MCHGGHTVPHLWLLGPGGWLCVMGSHAWGSGGDPYGPCLTAPRWAQQAIEAGEATAGRCMVTTAASVGVSL